MTKLELAVGKGSLGWTALGALGALGFLILGRGSPKSKRVFVSAIKEGYNCKEWVLTRTEQIRADVADAVAEAQHAHEQRRDLEELLEALASDKELLGQVQEMIRRKSATQG